MFTDIQGSWGVLGALHIRSTQRRTSFPYSQSGAESSPIGLQHQTRVCSYHVRGSCIKLMENKIMKRMCELQTFLYQINLVHFQFHFSQTPWSPRIDLVCFLMPSTFATLMWRWGSFNLNAWDQKCCGFWKSCIRVRRCTGIGLQENMKFIHIAHTSYI